MLSPQESKFNPFEQALFQRLIRPAQEQARFCPGLDMKNVIRGFIFMIEDGEELPVDSLEEKGMLVSSGNPKHQFQLTEAGIRHLEKIINLA